MRDGRWIGGGLEAVTGEGGGGLCLMRKGYALVRTVLQGLSPLALFYILLLWTGVCYIQMGGGGGHLPELAVM